MVRHNPNNDFKPSSLKISASLCKTLVSYFLHTPVDAMFYITHLISEKSNIQISLENILNSPLLNRLAEPKRPIDLLVPEPRPSLLRRSRTLRDTTSEPGFFFGNCLACFFFNVLLALLRCWEGASVGWEESWYGGCGCFGGGDGGGFVAG